MSNERNASLVERFCAPELIITTENPAIVQGWQKLLSGDVLGASLSAAALHGQSDEYAYAQLEASLAMVQGDELGATDILSRALPVVPIADTPTSLVFQLALCLHMSGNIPAAKERYMQALALQPKYLSIALSLAELCFEVDDFQSACHVLQEASHAGAGPEFWAARCRLERRYCSEIDSKKTIKAALSKFPNDVDLKNIWIAWLIKAKQFHTAQNVLNTLPDDIAGHPIVLTNKGNVFLGLHQKDEALNCFGKALEQSPELFQARLGLASAAFVCLDDEMAETSVLQALQSHPNHLDANVLLAKIYLRTQRKDIGINLLQQIVEIDPDNYSANYLLADVYREAFQFDLAKEYALRLPSLSPDAPEAYNVLGMIHLALGEFPIASEAFGQGAKLKVPGAPSSFSNLLYGQAYNPDITPQELYEQHRGYGRLFGGVADNLTEPFGNSRNPNRSLRIGYISPDFRAHSVAFFMIPIIEGHSRDDFEIYAYSNATKVDHFTDWFATHVDHWRDIRTNTYDEARELIRNDQIDILVELVGHTGNNVLPMLARRAAPVQVSYLGYPNTTGVPAMDYRVVDAVTDPLGVSEAQATEKLIRIPDSFLCYRMLHDVPSVSKSPMSSGRPITYGSFNNAMKINSYVFDAWAKILEGAPEASLLMKSQSTSCEGGREWIWNEFEQRDIARERVTLIGVTATLGEHLELYRCVDLALDTFPYNGTTTTCEALSMGVPVLTLKGDRHCAKVGESLLSVVGLSSDLIADDVDDYICRAIAFAARGDDLAVLRQGLRARILSSPLCDEPAFVSKLENAYRQMWREWCAGDHARYGLTPSVFEKELLELCEPS